MAKPFYRSDSIIAEQPEHSRHILCLSSIWPDRALFIHNQQYNEDVPLSQEQVEEQEALDEMDTGDRSIRILTEEDCRADHTAWFQYHTHMMAQSITEYLGEELPEHLRGWMHLNDEMEVIEMFTQMEAYAQTTTERMLAQEAADRADAHIYGGP